MTKNNFKIILVPTALILLVSCSITATSIKTTPQFNNSHIGETLLDYAFSPDGETLGIYSNAGIYLYDLETMLKTTFIEFDDKEYDRLLKSGAIAFSSDGKQIAVSGKHVGEPIQIFDSHNSTNPLTLSSSLSKDAVTELEFNPTGESILVRNTYQADCHGPKDKLFLYNLSAEEIVFEVEKCAIYPPIRFHFTKDEKAYVFLQSMSPEFDSYFIDSQKGEIIVGSCKWGKTDGFFGSSSQSNPQLLAECFPTETLDRIFSKGNVLLFSNIENHIIINYSAATSDEEYPIELWQHGERICEFFQTRGSPLIKASTNYQVFASENSFLNEQNTYNYRLFVWDTDSCENIGVWQFDSG